MVRLQAGDPGLHGALVEMTRLLDAAGVPWKVVPGEELDALAAHRTMRAGEQAGRLHRGDDAATKEMLAAE